MSLISFQPVPDSYITFSMDVDCGERRRGAKRTVSFDIEDAVGRQREVPRRRVTPHRAVRGPIDHVRRDIRTHDHGVLREEDLAHKSRIARSRRRPIPDQRAVDFGARFHPQWIVVGRVDDSAVVGGRRRVAAIDGPVDRIR